ncbi:hypothetical protein GCM10023083_09030 [Streptomyces phyllanthi]
MQFSLKSPVLGLAWARAERAVCEFKWSEASDIDKSPSAAALEYALLRPPGHIQQAKAARRATLPASDLLRCSGSVHLQAHTSGTSPTRTCSTTTDWSSYRTASQYELVPKACP